MLEKVQADRKAKLEKLAAIGVNPWGRRFDGTESARSIKNRYTELAEGEQPGQEATAAGRLVLLRDMGKMMFAHVKDSSDSIQVAFRKDLLPDDQWALAKLLDLGDIVGVAGTLMKTRTGEITIWAERLSLLCKSLLPMPEKHHGLQDTELRYRRRYLDLMANPDSMDTFKTRIAVIDSIRTILVERGYLEVETPMLQPIYGGAAARPFTTHHNALDTRQFLRISPELYLKRLLVGGMERVFEINRNFRNEGLSTRHNPEFTMLELYAAYADYEVMMETAEELFHRTVVAVCLPALRARYARKEAEIEAVMTNAERARKNKRSGTSPEQREADYAAETERYEGMKAAFAASPLAAAVAAADEGKVLLPYGEELIDYSRPWHRARYADLLAEHAGVSIDDIDGLRRAARERGIDEATMADAVVTNAVFEETVEKQLIRPVFVINYPADLCPLTRRNPDDPSEALRFELFIAGMEVANAYTELNDPLAQEENLSAQLDGENEETMRVMDEDFIAALRHGMPPAGGMGIGIDRMTMLLTDTRSIRDVILFPLLKPASGEGAAADRPPE